eukprot:TRINITY_DN6472_c0_g1_i1.p1 TRINITY_DN6472_c0_g1~~TRINITY_DN6472_c0_g1_i1.p1  ORF type:complete len:421 (+),score=67.67 TRINITY_DN6472_c0_g1_i1:86-1348(+)
MKAPASPTGRPCYGRCECCFGSSGSGPLAARLNTVPHTVLGLLLDLGAAFAVTWSTFWYLEVLLSCTTAVMSTLIYWWYGSYLAVNLSWTLVSFAVILPLTMSLQQAFRRRELAIAALARFRGSATNVFVAHMWWNWPSWEDYDGRLKGRIKKDAPEYPITTQHIKQVRTLMFRLSHALEAFLLLPRSMRARAWYGGNCGRAEYFQVEALEAEGASAIDLFLGRLHGATETLKKGGLPATEASRINNYLNAMSRDWELLRALKRYRTPQAMRSFSRVVIHLLPVFYGPYFVWVAKGDSGDGSALGIACTYAVLISLFLSGLFLVENGLENPFSTRSLDTVRVENDFATFRESLVNLLDDWSRSQDWDRDDELGIKWDNRDYSALPGSPGHERHPADRGRRRSHLVDDASQAGTQPYSSPV